MVFLTKTSTISIAVLTLVSCSGTSGTSEYDVNDTPADRYRMFLSEIRAQNELTTDSLIVRLRQWQTVKDSLFARIRQDTLRMLQFNTDKECAILQDSIRAEFARLTLSTLRTYNELLSLKESLSPYAGNGELLRSAEAIRPFFLSLDNHPAYRGDWQQILSSYRTFLAGTIRNGIHGRYDLMTYFQTEDCFFRTFLSRQHALENNNPIDIARSTETCCRQVFLAVERKEITYKEAVIYMALRTNRRIIQNVQTCLRDIRQGKITTSEQAHVYAWAVLQPYTSLDGLCMALLSSQDRERLHAAAAETPAALASLKEVMNTKNDRLDALPGMLMEIFIASL